MYLANLNDRFFANGLTLADDSLRTTLNSLAQLATAVFQAPAALITAIKADHVVLCGAAGLSVELLEQHEWSPEWTPCAHVIAAAAPVLLPDTEAYGSAPFHLRAYAGVPIIDDAGTVLGALCLIDTTPREWPEDLARPLGAFAAHILTHVEQQNNYNEVRAREELYHVLFAHAPIGQSLGSNDGTILTANPALCKMLGYTEAELVGMNFPSLTHPDDRERTYTYMEQMDAGVLPAFDFEKRYLCKDGSVIWARSSVAWVRGPDGEPRFGIGIFQDVTERRQLEEQIRHAHRMESVGQLAGGIAHDFNNLITAIRGFTEFALSALAADHPAHSDLLEVNKAAERAALLTQQLLAFARKQIIDVRVFDLNQLVLDLDSILRRLIGSNIELVILPAETPVLVRVDSGQIEQVLINMAVNARDAMPGGGKLTLEISLVQFDDARVLTQLGLAPGRHVRLVVSDTGVGISADVRQHIFEPFFTTKPPGQGTGLGLSTCYGIIKQHGGSIRVESGLDAGTSFEILLPYFSDTSAPAVAHVVTEVVEIGRETVLLVEDEPGVRILAARALRQHGYEVFEASNGDEALTLAQMLKRPPDLLLTDVVMPQMNGTMLANSLRQQYPDLKVLYMSGYPRGNIGINGQIDIETAFLQKPFVPEQLLRRVRAVLDE